MQVHPGKKIQIELRDRGWTQRQFAFLLWKKVSEVNELIKWKRNITVQWDILLSHVLWTWRKYWLDLQNEYEYSLIESDFDISKLPNIDQNVSSPDKKIHQTSEQEENKSSVSSPPSSPVPFTKEYNLAWREIEKKQEKQAYQAKHNLNKEHKTNKDADISRQQEKDPKLDWLKSTKINQNWPKLENINKEWQEKKDKKNRQKIYNPNDKFDSYFPVKAKKEKHWLTVSEIDQHWKHQKLDSQIKTITSKWKEKNNWNIETPQHWNNIHKHKEHIFRNF